jgi:hypothetical protein
MDEPDGDVQPGCRVAEPGRRLLAAGVHGLGETRHDMRHRRSGSRSDIPDRRPQRNGRRRLYTDQHSDGNIDRNTCINVYIDGNGDGNTNGIA